MKSDELTFYDLAGRDPELWFSPHCWKTRVALAHNGLEALSVPWRFSAKEAIAFSGQGSVPILKAGDSVMARFVNDWADSILIPAIGRIVVLDVHNCLAEPDKRYFRHSREKRIGQALEDVVADSPAHLLTLRQALAPLRRTFGEHAFLGGAEPTYVDYCVFGMFMWARCCAPEDILQPDDPIFVWREQLLDAFGGLARTAPSALS